MSTTRSWSSLDRVQQAEANLEGKLSFASALQCFSSLPSPTVSNRASNRIWNPAPRQARWSTGGEEGHRGAMMDALPAACPRRLVPSSRSEADFLHRMHSRREGLQFCITSLLEGNLLLVFAQPVGAPASREQCVQGRQKCFCLLCWTQS
jgi:hypothetical protein